MSTDIQYKARSYRGASAITPSDSANLATPVSGLYVGVSGNIRVLMSTGEDVTFTAVPVGEFPIAVIKVFATGTAATGLIGLR